MPFISKCQPSTKDIVSEQKQQSPTGCKTFEIHKPRQQTLQPNNSAPQTPQTMHIKLHLAPRQLPPNVDKLNIQDAVAEMATADNTPFSANSDTRPSSKLALRFRKQIWNTCMPASPDSHAPSSPISKRCFYRPGTRPFRYGRQTITYQQPCLQLTCANCRKWFPKLVYQPILWKELAEVEPENATTNTRSSKSIVTKSNESKLVLLGTKPIPAHIDLQENQDLSMNIGDKDNAEAATVQSSKKPHQSHNICLRFRSLDARLGYHELVLRQRRRTSKVSARNNEGKGCG